MPLKEFVINYVVDSNKDAYNEPVDMSETELRAEIAAFLKTAETSSEGVIHVPPLGYGSNGLSASDAAKIMGQELWKFSKTKPRSLKAVRVSVPDEATRAIYEEEVTSFIRHVQEDLGPGPYVCVDLIVELPQGIVVIERHNPPYGVALPGGFVDEGESLEEAARREIKEETNLEVRDLWQMHTYSDPGRDPRFHTVSTVYAARGIGTPASGDDAKAVHVISRDKILNLNFVFDHHRIVEDYLSGRYGHAPFAQR